MRNMITSCFCIRAPIRDIPVIGTLLKSYDLAHSVKEQLFARKILAFLQSIESCTDDERFSLLNKLQDEKESPERVGTALVMILDRLDDLAKPSLIGKLFMACARGAISADMLFRMCSYVDRLYIGDLKALSKIGKQIGFAPEELNAYMAAGLYVPLMRDPIKMRVSWSKQDDLVRSDELQKLDFEFTAAALHLAELLFDAKRRVYVVEV